MGDNAKMYIFVNTLLNMGKGKIAGQVGHGVSHMVRYLENNKNNAYKNWLSNGEAKIVLKASEDQLNNMIKKYNDVNSEIWCFEIHDLGKTQIAPNSLTVIAFNPIYDYEVPKDFKNYKLL
jgi:PTH2 family peptidyl-tRNA hydrolase